MQWVCCNQFPRGTFSLPPVVVKPCQKSNHKFQLARVGCSRGNLNRDALSLPPGVKTNSLSLAKEVPAENEPIFKGSFAVCLTFFEVPVEGGTTY